MPLTLEKWFEKEHKTLHNPFVILRDIALKLTTEFHELGKVHGALTPQCIVIDRTGNYLLSINTPHQRDDAFNRWLPVDEAPSPSLDVFSLGCVFYYVLSNGRHPFGDHAKDRKTLAQLNLYLLDHQVDYFTFYELVISKMLHANPENRLSIREILEIPMFYNEQQLSNYVIEFSKNADRTSEIFRYLEETVLHRDNSVSYGLKIEDIEQQNRTFSYHISTIINTVCENESTAFGFQNLFPKLALLMWSSQQLRKIQIHLKKPVTSAENRIFLDGFPLIVSSQKVEDDEKKKPFLAKRYPGRFLDRYVHVIEFQGDENLRKIEEKIQNDSRHSWLKIRKTFHDKSALKWFLAVDPFNETLETWVYCNNRKFTCKEAVWLMTSITSNVVKELPHEFITPGHIILMASEDKINDLKLAFLPIKTRLHTIEDLYYETWSHKSQQIVALSEIFSFILEHTENFKENQTSAHLIDAMRKEKSGIDLNNLKQHPLLWNDEKFFMFVLEAKEFYANHPYLGLNSISQSEIFKHENMKSILKGRELKTYRDLIKFLSVLIKETPEVAATVLDCYKDTLFRIWIKINKTRTSTECEEFKCLPENHEDSGIAVNEDAITFVPKSPGGFVVNRPNSLILKGEPSRIRNFIINYIEQFKQAQQDYGEDFNLTLNHTKIDRRGGNVLHLASHFNECQDLIGELLEIGFGINEANANGMTALHFAALTNSNFTAKKLIEKGANFELKDKTGRTPLFYAIVNKSVEVAKLLRHSGYVTNKYNALEMAVVVGSFAIVDFFIDEKSGTLDKALWLSVALNRRDIADLVLSYGAKPNGLIHVAIVNQSIDILELLIALNADLNEKDPIGQQTPLHVIASAERPNLKMAELLLDNGARLDLVDAEGCSVLHKAVFNENVDLVSLLVARGCEVNVKFNGVTPLHIAAQFNLLEIAKILVDNQGLIEILDEDGDTPLEYAVWADSFQVFKFLIESGALVSAPRSKSRSSLHVACALDSIRVADYLIKLGADVSATEQLGLTPVHYAQLMNNTKMIGLFEELEKKHLSVEEPMERAVELTFEQLSDLMKQFNFNRIKKVGIEAYAWPVICNFEGKNRRCEESKLLPKGLEALKKLTVELMSLEEEKERVCEIEALSDLLMVPNLVEEDEVNRTAGVNADGYDFYD